MSEHEKAPGLGRNGIRMGQAEPILCLRADASLRGQEGVVTSRKGF